MYVYHHAEWLIYYNSASQTPPQKTLQLKEHIKYLKIIFKLFFKNVSDSKDKMKNDDVEFYKLRLAESRDVGIRVRICRYGLLNLPHTM